MELSCVPHGGPEEWIALPTVLVERLLANQMVLDCAPHEWNRRLGKLVERAPA